MRVNSPMDKKTRKQVSTVINLIKVVISLAGALPVQEKYKLRPELRKCAHTLLNNQLSASQTYAESTMRKFYTTNMSCCAELKANLDIAKANNYLSNDIKRHIVALINKYEKIVMDTMNKHYSNGAEIHEYEDAAVHEEECDLVNSENGVA